MRAMWTYLRQHRWQRRALTVMLTLLAALLTAVLSFSYLRDSLLLRQLGSADQAVRSRAVERAAALAHEQPATRRRLAAALAGANERRFLGIAAALRRAGCFDEPNVGAINVDRLRAVELRRIRDADTKYILLGEVILAGRDNEFVRRALDAAASDESPDVRATSAVLAARLADDAALGRLLDDADPNVAGAAAVAAGLATRRALLPHLQKLLANEGAHEAQAGAAYAMACVDPNSSAQLILDTLARADSHDRRQLADRLLAVLAALRPPAAAPAVAKIIEHARRAGRRPSAMAIFAAGELHCRQAADTVRDILRDAVQPGDAPLVRQVLAALTAADALDIPCRREAHDICNKLWRPGWPLMLVAAVRLLARQAARPQPGQHDAPSTAECVRVLRLAAVYEQPAPPPAPPPAATSATTAPASAPATSAPASLPATAAAARPPPRRKWSTPLESAAAAVALWRLDTQLSDWYVGAHAAPRRPRDDARAANALLKRPLHADNMLPGDYIAWNLPARRRQAGGPLADPARAFELGEKFLPPYGADPNQREYSDAVRGTGALLLAAAARSAEQRAAAVRRIRSRLLGGPLGGEDNYYVRGTYLCALAALGQPAERRQVRRLLESGQFSPRRAIAALLMGGDASCLDWLLWNPQLADEDALFLLIDEQLGDVLAACLPSLPRVEPAGDLSLRLWQLRILRFAYALRRPAGDAPNRIGR